MPPLKAYDASLPYSYAAGVFPSLALMAAAPERATRLLLSERASGEGIDKLRAICREHRVRDHQERQGRKSRSAGERALRGNDLPSHA